MIELDADSRTERPQAAHTLAFELIRGRRTSPVHLDRLAASVERLGDTQSTEPLTRLGFGKALVELAGRAAPIVSRTTRLEAANAAAIRVPALIMARAADKAGKPKLAADLVHLAAATCLLEERARSAETLERLYLAYD